MEQPKPINCVTSCEAIVAALEEKIKRTETHIEKLHNNETGLARGKHIQASAWLIKELAQHKADLKIYKDHITTHQS